MKQIFTPRIRFVSMTAAMLLGAISCTKTEEAEPFGAQSETQEQRIVLMPTRSYDEALALAQQSLEIVDRGTTRALQPRAIRSTRGQCVTVPSTRNGESQIDTLMYVFNFEGDNGFSVIAANRAVDPVLAVVENGNYTYGVETGVENFDFYMEALAAELQATVSLPIDTMISRPTFKNVEVDIDRHCDPLLPVKWGQEDDFGKYANNGLSGCIATAIGQIMAYYQYPTSITTTYPNNGFTQHYGETIALDWERMIANSSGYQISALLREIGQKVGMNYIKSKTESTADISKVPGGFKAFGYSCASSYSEFNIYSIRNTLDNKRPVFVDGRKSSNTRKGHDWIADGYIYKEKGTRYYELKLVNDGVTQYWDYVLVSSTVVITDLIHYNWGWDGNYDGYFATTNSIQVADRSYVSLSTLVPTL